METVKCDVWSAGAIEILEEIVRVCKKMVLKVMEPNHGGQCFGRLLFNYDDSNNESHCVAKMLCERNEAIASGNYLDGELKSNFSLVLRCILCDESRRGFETVYYL